MNKIKIDRNYSNQLTVSFAQLARFKYWWVQRLIVKKFDLNAMGETVKTLDAIWREYEVANQKLTIDWDCISGFSVTARSVDAEPLIHEIAEFLTRRYDA